MAQANAAYLPSRTSVTKQIVKQRPVLDHLLRLQQSGATLLTDANVLPGPSIERAAQVVDIVTGALSEIMVGAPLQPRLASAQTALEKLLAPA
jgi:hypothetical protein